MLKWLFCLIVIIVLAVGGGTAYWRHELNSPIALDSPHIYEVHGGDGIRATLWRLKSEGVITREWPLQLLEIVNRRALMGLKVGEFRLEPGMTELQMIRKLSSNEVVTYTITVPEGRTFEEMRELFDQAPKLKIETAGLDDKAFMAKIGHPNEQPEGRFFPATYRYTKGMTDVQLYQQAYNLMSRTLHEVWNNRDPDLPYDSPYQALIMASLVEEEAARASERAPIAGVFVRRLEKGMRLQTDPSVVYGLHLTSGNQLTRADLEQMTPYNTYRINGLTPTPIALPGYASLEAAVHPDDSNALYFVAKGNGYHEFSATLQEHDAAVRRYILNAHKSVNQGLGTELDDTVIALATSLLAHGDTLATEHSAADAQGDSTTLASNAASGALVAEASPSTAKDSDASADDTSDQPVTADSNSASSSDTEKTDATDTAATTGAAAAMDATDITDSHPVQPAEHSTLTQQQRDGVNTFFHCDSESVVASVDSDSQSGFHAEHHQTKAEHNIQHEVHTHRNSAQPATALQDRAVCHAMRLFDTPPNGSSRGSTTNAQHASPPQAQLQAPSHPKSTSTGGNSTRVGGTDTKASQATSSAARVAAATSAQALSADAEASANAVSTTALQAAGQLLRHASTSTSAHLHSHVHKETSHER